MVNSSKIKARIKELGLTQADVAKYLGIAQPTANQKINNIRLFDVNEALELSELLELRPEDIPSYFFVK